MAGGSGAGLSPGHGASSHLMLSSASSVASVASSVTEDDDDGERR